MISMIQTVSDSKPKSFLRLAEILSGNFGGLSGKFALALPGNLVSILPQWRRQWRHDEPRMTAVAKNAFVVGLSGVPGSGKTTLLKLLLRDHPRAQPIAYDRFHPDMSDEEISDWVRRSGDPNEIPLGGLIRALERLTKASALPHQLILFETAFGRAHRRSGAFIAFSVWIDTPLDIALARANLVFLRNAERNPSPTAASDFIPWLTRYMTDYPLLRRMYVAMSERGKTAADLVIDGTRSAEASAALINAALAERSIV